MSMHNIFSWRNEKFFCVYNVLLSGALLVHKIWRFKHFEYYFLFSVCNFRSCDTPSFQCRISVPTVQVGLPESSVATLSPFSTIMETSVSGTFSNVCSYVAALADAHLLFTRAAVHGN